MTRHTNKKKRRLKAPLPPKHLLSVPKLLATNFNLIFSFSIFFSLFFSFSRMLHKAAKVKTRTSHPFSAAFFFSPQNTHRAHIFIERVYHINNILIFYYYCFSKRNINSIFINIFSPPLLSLCRCVILVIASYRKCLAV